MRHFKTLLAVSGLSLGIALPTAPAAAQQAAPAAITVGMAVKDTNGGDVGTVTKVDGAFVMVKTDKHEARLPANSFTPHEGALLFGMSRDQLNAAIEQQLAAANAKLVPGAAVSDPAGAAVGTITATDANSITVKLQSGLQVRLPRTGVAPGPNGAVVGMTAAALEAAAKASAPPAPPAH
jgi:preprotein translocase subunit YajC